MPSTPYQLTVTSQLSQDFVTSDQAAVDGGATNQVAVFRNAAKGAAVEALVIPESGGTAALSYLAQSADSTTGWELLPLSDASGEPVLAAEVVACATTWGTVSAFIVDPQGKLWRLDLGADGWSAPVACDAPSNLERLRVSYSPGAGASQGQVVVYAVAGGQALYVGLGSGGSFTDHRHTLDQEVEDLVLAFVDTAGGLLMCAVQSTDSSRGLFYLWKGTVSASSLGVDASASFLSGMPSGKGLFLATAMDGTSDRMLLQLCLVPVDGQNKRQLSWLLNPDGKAVSGGLEGAFFDSAAVVETSDGFCHVYGIGSDMTLQVVHQVAYDPGQMGSGYSTGQTWGPLVGLRSGVRAVYADPMPSDAPALVSVGGDFGSLSVHIMDPETRLWLSQPVTLPTESRYPLTRWRTKATVYDADGQPVSGLDLTVGADSTVEVQANGAYSVIDSQTTCTVTTDARGQATVATLATSLTTPALRFRLPDQDLGGHAPAGYINDWFAGTTQIPGMDAFSASLLQSATVDGRPLAPDLGQSLSAEDAAELIAQVGSIMATPDASEPVSFAKTPGKVQVFSALRGRPARATYDSLEAVSASRTVAALGGPVSFSVVDTISDVWDDVWDFAGDVWDAITQGFIQLAEVAVDVAKGVVQIVVWIGDQLVQLADWIVETVEDALQAIVAVFKWIGALVEDLIKFLEALFDLDAIWNTKDAFYSALIGLPEWLKGQVGDVSGWLHDNALADLSGAVESAFDTAIAAFGDQPVSSLSGWSGSGPPDSSTQVAGMATPDDMTNNVGANWFTDQVENAGVDLGISGVLEDEAVQNFIEAIQEVWTQLQTTFTDFGEDLLALFDADDLSSFADLALKTLLDLVKNLLLTVIDLADAVLQALLAVVQVAMDALVALLQTPLDIPIISSLYEWLAELAGHSGDKLSIGNLLALMAAFPVTVVYKLVMGTDEEPFPGGTFPGMPSLDGVTSFAATSGAGQDWNVRSLGVVGGLLTCLSTVWAVASDASLNFLDGYLGPVSAITTGLDLLCSISAANGWGWFEAGIVGVLTGSAGAVGIAGTVWIVAFVSETFFDVAFSTLTAGLGSIATKDVKLTIGSLLGAGILGLHVYDAFTKDQSELAIAYGLIEPWPLMCSFLTADYFLATGVGVLGVPVKIFLDIVADVSGGVLEVVDYSVG